MIEGVRKPVIVATMRQLGIVIDAHTSIIIISRDLCFSPITTVLDQARYQDHVHDITMNFIIYQNSMPTVHITV